MGTGNAYQHFVFELRWSVPLTALLILGFFATLFAGTDILNSGLGVEEIDNQLQLAGQPLSRSRRLGYQAEMVTALALLAVAVFVLVARPEDGTIRLLFAAALLSSLQGLALASHPVLALPGHASQRVLHWLLNAGYPLVFVLYYQFFARFPVRVETSRAWRVLGWLVTLGAVTSYVDTSVTAGIQYWYRVRATNSAGDADWSNVAEATPTEPGDVHAAADGLEELVIISPEGDSDDAVLLAAATGARHTTVAGPSDAADALIAALDG